MDKSHSHSKMCMLDEKTTNTKNFPFKFLNLLFSNHFSERFVNLGDSASRSELDTGKSGNNQKF